MKTADWLWRTVQRTVERAVRQDGPHAIDDASLIGLLDSAHTAHQGAVESCRVAVTAATRHLSGLDAANEEIRLLIGRHRDVEIAARRVREALERAQLAALNAGLEGARMGEAAGRAVATISDDVRQALGRGLDALDEHVNLLEQLNRQRQKLYEQFSATQETAGELQQSLTRGHEMQQNALAALTELLERVQKATGADRQTLRWMSQVGRQAQELVRLLGEMPVGPARQMALGMLGPALRALERQLQGLDAEGGPHADRPDQDR